MSTSGLITMLFTEISVVAITAYFFFKVLFAKPKEEIADYSEDEIIDK